MPEKGKSVWKADRRTFLKVAGATAGGSAMWAPNSIMGSEGTYPDLAQMRIAHENAGIISPGKTYRMMEWEFHIPPQADFRIDVEGAVKAARDSGAESLMFYTQGHWGYALYPSDSAVRQPNLDYDLFGKEVSLARKYGISSTAYYSLQFNNQCVLAHPDWAWVNEAGEKQQLRWYIPCLDSPYRQYVLSMMDEIFARYDVAELFLDILEFNSSNITPGEGIPSVFANIQRMLGTKTTRATRIARGSRLVRAGNNAINGTKNGP